MKIILDTNVLMSGIFWAGPPHQILKAWKSGKIHLIVSREILAEYYRVSDILAKKYPSVDLSTFMELLSIHAGIHVPAILSMPVSSDPDDDKFIACALGADVKLIVSGDRDLLNVSGFQGIDVLSPANFIKKFLT